MHVTSVTPSTILPDLKTLPWLQGSPSDLTHNLQLMLLIQPNCPGCHAHAIPVANALHSQKQKKFDIYCVSTAFEDFELNNMDSAALMLKGSLVGDAQCRLGDYTDSIPEMPLAHDFLIRQIDASTALLDLALESTKCNAREQLKGVIPTDILESRLSKATYDMLPPKIATIFWTVRAQGTPTWVLHKSNGEILGKAFGHKSEEDIECWIARLTGNQE